jgi:hypothetical protein
MPALEFDAKEYGKYIVDASGTPYMMVAGRVLLAHKSGQLIGAHTEKIHEDEDVIQVKATVTVLNYDTFQRLKNDGVEEDTAAMLATQEYSGLAESDKHAVDKNGKPTAEGNRPLEVAETSALGRALGVAGFGPLDSIASADEIFTLLTNGRKDVSGLSGGGKLTEGQEKFLKDLIQQKLGQDPDAASMDKFGKPFDQITRREGSPWIEALKSMPVKGGSSRRKTASANVDPGF